VIAFSTPLERLVAIALLALASSCATIAPREVGVQPTTFDAAQRERSRSALSSYLLSEATREALRLLELDDEAESNPLATVRALHPIAVASPSRPTVFALAELCYLHAKMTSDRSSFLAASLYAERYLLQKFDEPLNVFDRRFRWAIDIHNRGLLRAGCANSSTPFVIEPGEYALPVGTMKIDHGEELTGWLAAKRELLPVDGFEPWGLGVRLREAGVGVPLIVTARGSEGVGIETDQPYQLFDEFPATITLLSDVELSGWSDEIEVELELHTGFGPGYLELGEERVPLRSDRSVALAHWLDRPELWTFAFAGFFDGSEAEDESRLLLSEPYRPGAIPVVFVHGTASSPGYWADLYNTIQWDPALRRTTQCWFFQYASGPPVAYSAANLREALTETVAALDPEGEDPALHRMILVGHSQGGLLVRMMLIGGEMSWLEEVVGEDVDELPLTDEDRALLERCLEFEPLEFVSSAVFLSTPHRGSFQTQRWYSELVAEFVSLPGDFLRAGLQVVSLGQLNGEENTLGSITSVDSMTPGSPLLERLDGIPLQERYSLHSIIPIGDADPDDPEQLAKADDGVVEYTSAHLEGADSEVLVPGGHSCQSHPRTIREVRRVLTEAVEDLAAETPESGASTPRKP